MRPINDLTSIQNIERLLNEFSEQAQHIDEQNRRQSKKVTEQWFSLSLFHTRSSIARDYVEETKRLLAQLLAAKREESQRFLAEKLSAQIEALATALRSGKLPEQAEEQREIRASHYQLLHEKLVTYRDYERRLTENLSQAQSTGSQEAVQIAQKRLNRCQMAIVQLERQIQNHDEG